MTMIDVVSREELLTYANEIVMKIKKCRQEGDDYTADILFSSLYTALKPTIKNKLRKLNSKVYSISIDDLQGIANEVLWLSVLRYDGVSSPFIPYYLNNIEYAVKMILRSNSRDLYGRTYDDTLLRLDVSVSDESEATLGDLLGTTDSGYEEVEQENLVNKVLDECFGDDNEKKYIVRLYLAGYKRAQILEQLKKTTASDEALKRKINRAVKKFKENFVKLT